MLQFILGRASSGKSYTVTEQIANRVQCGEEVILIVPEQFSFESEKRVLDRLGDGDAQGVSVLSFSRLCDAVERENGGICGTSLSDADKNILMGKAMARVKPNLKRWGKYSNSAGFASLLVDTINEFKLNSVTVDTLRTAAQNAKDEQLVAKLYDIALIFEEFEAVIAERFIDPHDRLTKLYDALGNFKFFSGKTVFFDSFKGFTGQQFRIFERIVCQARDVVVSLTDNPCDQSPYGMFSNIKKTKQRLENTARRYGVKINKDIILDGNFYNAKELSAVEQYMCCGKTDFEGKAPNITVCRAESVYSEAEFVARNIRRIVRENGASYSDFVVIARDTAPYEDALKIACEKNDINCFIDRRLPLSALPPAVVLSCACELALGLTTEKILRFHKSGINLLSFDEITTLENYTFLWEIDGRLWLQEWTMNPNGFNPALDGKDEQQVEQLKTINELRLRAVMPILKFRKAFSGTAADMSRALVELLDECNAQKAFIELSDEYKKDGNPVFSEALKQCWDNLMHILNSIAVCFGEEAITPKEFYNAFTMSVGLDTVGVIPQMIDQVTFGAADRIRPSRPKYAFIMGANQGVFPRTVAAGGIFAANEREKLISLGVEIPDKTLSEAVDEEFLLYSNVCCATDKLFVSYRTSVDGVAAEASAFVGGILDNFDCNFCDAVQPLSEESLPETKEDAFSYFCQSVNSDNDDLATIGYALKDIDEIGKRVSKVQQSAARPQFSISRETAHKLFGNRLRMSASKFDSFSRCKFMYFCRYGLSTQPLQSASFNPMQRGTLVHYVLQRAVEDYGKGLSSLSMQEISKLVDEYIDEYLDSIPGYRSVESARMKYLVSTISRTLKYVVERLAKEFAQSDFEPLKCELRIGYGGDVPELKIPVEEYGELVLTGFIDRLDKWNGYIRIIDYKTGSRDFKLPDILVGQNMQMLIYLYAVCKNEKFGGTPAGIFYMPAARDKEGKAANRRMHGLMAANEELLYAMDKENKGEFVPKLPKTSVPDSFISEEAFPRIFEYVEKKLASVGKAIFEGSIAADPVDGIDSGACKYCDYASVCRIEKEKIKAVPKLSNNEVLAEIERQMNEDGV